MPQTGVFGGLAPGTWPRPADPHLRPQDAPEGFWTSKQLPCPAWIQRELVSFLHVVPGQTAGAEGQGTFQRPVAKAWTRPLGYTGQGLFFSFIVDES